MKRDLNQLCQSHYDVLVIGGGIHGAAIAHEMTTCGLHTALIEQKDFSHATSANSLKIIHGGIRYLQQLDFKRIRESILSRRKMICFAPYLVRPLPCMMPLYGHGLRGKEVMRVALLLNDLVSWDRNQNTGRESYLPGGKLLSKSDCLKHIPDLQKNGLSGAAVWHDALAVNTERLTLAFVLKAFEEGAAVANYIKATDLKINRHLVSGVLAEDTLTGETFEINAKVVVNATGPWLECMLPFASPQTHEPMQWAKGVNIIVKKSLFSGFAVGLEGENEGPEKDAIFNGKKRLFFFVPWRGYTIIGTSYKQFHKTPDQLRIDEQDIESLIKETNRIYPAANLTFNDVSFFHTGLLPARVLDKPDPFDVRIDNRAAVIDHEKIQGLKGLLSIKSVKYTTAPQMAKKVKDILGKKGIFSILKKRDSEKEEAKWVCHVKTLPDDPVKREEMTEPLSHAPPLTAADVVFSVREEMALKLSDIVFRRTGLGTAECPSKNRLTQVADLMADELGWGEIRKRNEIREVLDYYSPLATYASA